MSTGGYPWRMLNTVRSVSSGQVQEYTDEFTGASLGADWTHHGWTVYSVVSAGLPTVGNGYMQVLGTKSLDLRTAAIPSQNASTGSYREASLIAWSAPTASMAYLFLDMDDTTPDPNTASVSVAMEFNDPPRASSLTINHNGQPVAFKSWGIKRPASPPWTSRISIDAGNVVRAYWSSPTIPDLVYSLGSYDPTGSRVGIGLRAPWVGARVFADRFAFRYFAVSGIVPNQALVGSAGGSLYYESTSGTMVRVSSNLTLASDEWLSSAARLEKVYIADHAVKLKNTNGTGSTAGSTLTDTTVSFTDAGVDADDDMLEIISGTGSTVGTYMISSVTDATHLVVTGDMDTGASATAVKYRIVRAPKVFDTATLAITRLTAAGSGGYIPPGCSIVAVYGDRLAWAGDPDLAEAVYMSKIGTVDNYNYGTNLVDQAFVYDPARVAGAPYIGDAVTALIPHLSDYLIIGCKRSIWMQRGDPALGIPPDSISREIGVLSQSAWCYTPENTIVAMTHDGLYLIAPSPGAEPQRLSRDRMPQELVNINPELFDVLVEYDTLRNGVNIFVTPRSEGSTRHFWFGWQLKEFSPESYKGAFEPTAIVSHAISGIGPRRVILGCRDGYLRVHEDAESTDDGENFASNVLIGPLMLGGGGYGEGMLREVVGQLAEDSGPVTMSVRVGDSVESAYAASSRVSYTMRAGKNRTWRPNLRGNACFIELSSDGGAAWAMEQLSIVREALGKQRLLA